MTEEHIVEPTPQYHDAVPRMVEALNILAMEINHIAKGKGWWDGGVKDRNDAEMICLMHSELSEALEGLRHGNPPSEKIGQLGFSQVEEELADTIIRILDMALVREYNIGGAVAAKIEYNHKRPFKHGGKKF